MREFLVEECEALNTPEMLVEQLSGEPGIVLLRSGTAAETLQGPQGSRSGQDRFSFVTARPFLTFRSFGSKCILESPGANARFQFGNPWHLLDSLISRYECLDEWDVPFPLGGCFGHWGYDLKNFFEPKLSRRAVNDLELPDCHLGFYDSLVAFDHFLGKTWIVSTGLAADGSRSEGRGRRQSEYWRGLLAHRRERAAPGGGASVTKFLRPAVVSSNLSREDFIAKVRRAQACIQAGDIYQVNLSQRLATPIGLSGWEFYNRLSAISPAPYSAFLDCGDFQLVSSSPELFLGLSGRHVTTRPIKGTRARSVDPARDAQLSYELQTSPKETAELVMITDLLRNDLGKVCEFGSVQVAELFRLERYPHVQHLVSTVEGRLRREMTHFGAFASCFPGGSVTGAPKFRAMQIIDELEPVTRGPYTGALGYVGFNRESQLSIVIRAAICRKGMAYFQVGAGIVADSDPAAEFDETISKARGFLDALEKSCMSG
ncbi:MAG TPA: anthranilate synthase component I family protein [Verrucomicrobiae bacterium]|nr:anthranilate synthase component I family protein [Verrucomicrobiae bacterium]